MRCNVRLMIISLTLGVVTTFLIAWACGLFGFGWGVVAGGTFSAVVPNSGPQAVSRGVVSGSRISAFGADQILIRNSLTAALPGDAPIVIGFVGTTSDRQTALITQSSEAGARQWIGTEVGWPWLALACEFSDVDGQRGGWTLEQPNTVGGPVRTVAIRPLWPGFVLNAMIYAAGWLLILFAPRASRRALRRRRGQCERCGYDLRAHPEGLCPECGFAREVQKHREALPTEAPLETRK